MMETEFFKLIEREENQNFTRKELNFDMDIFESNLLELADKQYLGIPEVEYINNFYNIPIKHVPFTEEMTIYDHIIADNHTTFTKLKEQTYFSPTVLYDGVCANGKTTLLETLFSNHNIKSYKHTNQLKVGHMNTTSIDALGYIMSFHEAISKFETPTICDRAPCNNLDWSIIWSGIVKYNDDVLGGSTSTIRNVFSHIKEYYDTIHPITKEFMYMFPTVIVVDSDFRDNAIRLRKRGEREINCSDINRSYWDFYIPMQYYYYSLKRKENNVVFINLGNYKNATFSEKNDAISKIMMNLIDIVCKRCKPLDKTTFQELEYTKQPIFKHDTFDSNLLFNFIKDQGKMMIKKC